MLLNLEKLLDAVVWKPYFDINYKEYYLQNILANTLSLMRLEEILEPCDNDAIATVGSDARLEKGYNSKLELVILTDKITTDKINTYTKEIGKIPNIHPIIEFKGDYSRTYVYQNNNKKVFPSRPIDLRFITGNYERFVNQKERFLKEAEFHNKSIKKALKEKKKYYLKILINGKANFKGKTIVHYDLEKAKVIYDDREYWGLKYGPLRAVQAVINQKLYRIIHETNDLKFFLQIPRVMIGKLMILTEKKLYTPQESADIVDSYTFFLREYHLSQWLFKYYTPTSSLNTSKKEYVKFKDRSLLERTLSNCELKINDLGKHKIEYYYNTNDWLEIRNRISSLYKILSKQK